MLFYLISMKSRKFPTGMKVICIIQSKHEAVDGKVCLFACQLFLDNTNSIFKINAVQI